MNINKQLKFRPWFLWRTFSTPWLLCLGEMSLLQTVCSIAAISVVSYLSALPISLPPAGVWTHWVWLCILNAWHLLDSEYILSKSMEDRLLHLQGPLQNENVEFLVPKGLIIWRKKASSQTWGPPEGRSLCTCTGHRPMKPALKVWINKWIELNSLDHPP